MSVSGQDQSSDIKYKHEAQGQSILSGVNASTTQLRETHSKFVDLTRKQLGDLYSKRDEINATIEDKERALSVCEKLLESLAPQTVGPKSPSGW